MQAVIAITNSVLNSPCFAWHPYGKLELFKTELVIKWEICWRLQTIDITSWDPMSAGISGNPCIHLLHYLLVIHSYLQVSMTTKIQIFPIKERILRTSCLSWDQTESRHVRLKCVVRRFLSITLLIFCMC